MTYADQITRVSKWTTPPTSPIVELFVEGSPAPAGSKTAVTLRDRTGNPRMAKRGGKVFPVLRYLDDAKGNKAWTKAVRQQAREHWTQPPLDRPVWVEVLVFFSRPKSHLHADGTVKPTAPVRCDRVFDVDKLQRSTFDALAVPKGKIDKLTRKRVTSDPWGLWKNDSRIVAAQAFKFWANVGEKTGMFIRVLDASEGGAA